MCIWIQLSSTVLWSYPWLQTDHIPALLKILWVPPIASGIKLKLFSCSGDKHGAWNLVMLSEISCFFSNCSWKVFPPWACSLAARPGYALFCRLQHRASLLPSFACCYLFPMLCPVYTSTGVFLAPAGGLEPCFCLSWPHHYLKPSIVIICFTDCLHLTLWGGSLCLVYNCRASPSISIFWVLRLCLLKWWINEGQQRETLSLPQGFKKKKKNLIPFSAIRENQFLDRTWEG